MEPSLERHPLEIALDFRYLFQNEFENEAMKEALNDPIMGSIEPDVDAGILHAPLHLESFNLAPGINGMTLRVTHDILRDQCIIEFTGVVRRGQLQNNYTMPFQNAFFIDASKAGSVARFIGYSCDSSNCYLGNKWVNGEWRLYLFATRAIKKSEELKVNFNYKYGDHETKLACTCGSRGCSGWIGVSRESPKTIAATAYTCKVCSKQFSKKGNLLQHLSVHDDERPKFECSFCDRSYFDKRGLNRHIKVHHSISKEKFKCAKCDKSYLRKDTLEHHVRVKHIDDNERRLINN